MTTSNRVAAQSDDDSTLEGLGYRQQLRRSLGFISMFTVSFSVISITTGIFTNLGFGIANLGPAAIWTWPIVVVGTLVFSLILAELGSRIPIAGIGYQWGARLVSPGLGWVMAVIIFSAFMLASGGETLLLIAPLIADVFNLTATQTDLVLISIGVFIVVALINILSVRLTARVNNISLVTELVGTVILGVTLLIAFLTSHHKPHTASFLFSTTNPAHNPALYGFALACLMSIFTITGMESASDLGEEGVGVRRSVPRAIIGSVALSGIFGMITLVCVALAIPNLDKAAASPTPIAYITNYWLGTAWGKVFIIFIIYSVFALIVVSIAAMARLLFSLARDNMFPGSHVVGKVNDRTKTPITAILITTFLFVVVMLIAAKFPSTYVILISSTPILVYFGYLVLTISYAVRRNKVAHIPTAFDLGKWAVPVFIFSGVYLVAALCVLTIPHVFLSADKTAAIVIGIGIVYYVAYLHRKITRGEAGRSLVQAHEEFQASLNDPEQPGA